MTAAAAAVEEAMGGAERAGRRGIHKKAVLGCWERRAGAGGGSEIERERRTVLAVGPTERKTKQNKIVARNNKLY